MKDPAAYPLCWPAGLERTKYRKSDQFKVGIDVARKELMREVGLFGGKNVVVSSNWAAFDGKLPNDPGIAVWFQWKGKWRCIACDTYSRFIANIRAVGLTIEALRTMERYGTQMLDQLMEGVNFEKALPHISGRSWWLVLGVPETANRAQVDEAYRRLAKERHPDSGGSHEQMAELNNAYDEAKETVAA